MEDATVERDFYAVEAEDGSLLQDVEELLAHMETDAAGALSRVIGGTFPPTEADRGHIAGFVAAQWLRGWDMREAMSLPIEFMARMTAMNATKSSVRQFLRQKENREVSDEEVEDLVAFGRDPANYRIEVHANELIRQMLRALPGLANLAFARKWQLLSTQNESLVTSDAPVSMWTHPANQRAFYGNGGFGMSDELSLPIDRRYALVLAHEAPSGEVVREVGQDHVRVLNGRTAASGRRYIIHHPDDDPLRDLVLPPARPKMSMSQPPWRMVKDDD